MPLAALLLLCSLAGAADLDPRFARHVIAEGFLNQTAVAADWTGDGRLDVISADIAPGRERVLLFVAPDWKPILLHEGVRTIHGAALDVDGDGLLDFVGARYHPGRIYWLRRPADPLHAPWPATVVDDEVDGVHGLLVADVDGDRRPDLIAGSGQPTGKLPDSLVWFSVHRGVWRRHVFADRDATGLTHYLAFGDVNGDGRGDIASAAKDSPGGNWFAWWEQPPQPASPWTRHWIARDQLAATNIVIADFNRDGRADFAGSRGHGDGLALFLAPGWRPLEIAPGLRGIHALDTADLDRDGDIDIAGVARDSKVAFWLENDGRGRFTRHDLSLNQSAYDLRVTDLDGDGDPDLLVAGNESRNVVWFENRIPRKSGE